jgi:hypothetical protein
VSPSRKMPPLPYSSHVGDDHFLRFSRFMTMMDHPSLVEPTYVDKLEVVRLTPTATQLGFCLVRTVREQLETNNQWAFRSGTRQDVRQGGLGFSREGGTCSLSKRISQ